MFAGNLADLVRPGPRGTQVERTTISESDLKNRSDKHINIQVGKSRTLKCPNICIAFTFLTTVYTSVFLENTLFFSQTRFVLFLYFFPPVVGLSMIISLFLVCIVDYFWTEIHF